MFMKSMDVINLLEKAMTGSALRHTVLTNNLTNVNTPNFKRSEVNFRSTLEEVLDSQLTMKTTKAAHLQTNYFQGSPQISVDRQTSLRNDGNNVDLDVELANLAENSIYYNSLVRFLSSQLSLLRQAITEGRR